MSSENFIDNYVSDLIQSLKSFDKSKITTVSNLIIKSLESKSQIFLLGNGGSSATPSHSAGDFSKELKVRAICLTDNTPGMTAWANDESYRDIFSEQLNVFLNPGDLILLYSGSGNSENVVNAAKFCNKRGNTVIGVTGNYNGKGIGEIEKYCDEIIYFQTESMERIEDLQLIFNHIVKELVKEKLKN